MDQRIETSFHQIKNKKMKINLTQFKTETIEIFPSSHISPYS
jgi:hypothetical protein